MKLSTGREKVIYRQKGTPVDKLLRVIRDPDKKLATAHKVLSV